MPEIKPKIVEGEPMCSCYYCGYFVDFGDYDYTAWRCTKLQLEVDEGDPCVPGLRQQLAATREQRDEAKRRAGILQESLNERGETLVKLMAQRDEALVKLAGAEG
ncbi:MAG: hypothetical protein GY849_06510, partial [Deltaproteobacteria bacterium]|nr:hypothetical protein [Deltaproteobacteria bacterium]